MTYTLKKGNVKYQVRIDKESAELTRSVGETVDTSKTAMTPMEANRKVNELLQRGYKATKR